MRQVTQHKNASYKNFTPNTNGDTTSIAPSTAPTAPEAPGAEIDDSCSGLLPRSEERLGAHSKPSSPKQQAPASATRYRKGNATDTSTQVKTFLSLFNTARSVGIDLAVYTKTLRALKDAGKLEGAAFRAFKVALDLGSKGDLKGMEAVLSKATSSFKGLGTAMSVLSGLTSAGINLAHGDYRAAMKSVFKTAAGIVSGGTMNVIDTVQSLLVTMFPQHKDHPLIKFIGVFNPLEFAAIGADSMVSFAYQTFRLVARQEVSIPELARLVERMRSGGVGALVDFSEKYGIKIAKHSYKAGRTYVKYATPVGWSYQAARSIAHYMNTGKAEGIEAVPGVDQEKIQKAIEQDLR